MNRYIAGLVSALLLGFTLGMSSGAYAQSLQDANSGDAFYYRGTGGVSPP